MPNTGHKLRVLSLDIATTTGWACWGIAGIGDNEPTFGAEKFPSELGKFADGFENWLLTKILFEDITHIVMESAYPNARANFATSLRLNWAHVNVMKIGVARSIPVYGVHVGHWRKYFIDCYRAPKEIPKNKRRAWLKQACINECLRRGWAVNGSDDAADALGLLTYALTKLEIFQGGSPWAKNETDRDGTKEPSESYAVPLPLESGLSKPSPDCETSAGLSLERRRLKLPSRGIARKKGAVSPPKSRRRSKKIERALAA